MERARPTLRDDSDALPSSSSAVSNRPEITIKMANLERDGLAIRNFLNNLTDKTYSKRFSDASKDVILDNLDSFDSIFLACHDTKVVGMADASDASHSYPSGKVAQVNFAVDDKYQKFGIGRRLVVTQDSYLKQQGYEYKHAMVYRHSNPELMDTLLRNGWKESTQSSDFTEDAE